MPAYTSLRSRKAYASLHPRIQRVLDAVISEQDHTLLSGYRSHREQDGLYAMGRTAEGSIVTNARGGESMHNCSLENDEGVGGIAFDLVPYPIDWDNKERFALLAGRVLQEGARQGVKIRWGNDWDGDGLPVSVDPDEQFPDPGHFEAVLDKP